MNPFLNPPARNHFFAGLLLLLSTLVLFLHIQKLGADENHYLAWGHSIYYDADLLLFNQFDDLHLSYFLTPTGFAGELRNFGVAIFWLPFYAISSGTTFWTNRAGLLADSPAILLAINWSSFLYIALSLILTFVIVRDYFSDRVAWLSILILFFGTPMLFYTIQRPISSHPVTVFLVSLLLFV